MDNYSKVETSFSFRARDGIKRPTVEVEHPVLNTAGIVAALQNPESNEAKLIQDAVDSLFITYIRGFVDANVDFDQAAMNALVEEGKISIENLANLPKSERNVLSKEDLEAFAKDYIAIMPGATGKEPAKVQSAAGLMVEKFKRVAGDNAVLRILQDQLAVFVEKAPEQVTAKHEKALNYLASKLEELLSIKVTADSL